MKLSLGEIAKLLRGGLIGGSPDIQISRVSLIEKSGEGDIVCLFDKKSIDKLSSFTPSAIVAGKELGVDIPTIVVAHPLRALSQLLNTYYPPLNPQAGVSPMAFVSDAVELGNDISIAPFVFVGEGAKIGNRVTLYPGAYIGNGVTIGDDTIIYANVSIRDGVSVGKRVILHAGTSIGSDGFGFYPDESGVYNKIPQVGGVVLEDDVNIGSNSCVDRGTIGNTVISKGTKIDNLVQVGHNCNIGANTVVAGQSGISGSVDIGQGGRIGGNVGIADHVTIVPNTTLAAKAGVIGDIDEAGIYAGFPTTTQDKWRRIQASLRHLPELLLKVREQEKRIIELENKIEEKRCTK
ncbi:MAG: UDP-3-O-(3-hydroxymyristoyl)glucosamine N-acyltransferase, partial [Nitrospinota bacterium]|nr:UDP-3-O-(3-hydroxymyristoyl)glucosamine N-acyltransferase [Nitrospinota bacterium]